MVICPKEYKDLFEDKKNLNGVLNGLRNFSLPEIDSWEKRSEFQSAVSWHIPTRSLVLLLKQFSPIVSVASGLAYTESWALKGGADIIATDKTPGVKNPQCVGKPNMEVEKLSAISAVKKYKDRNVFMAWPPYATSMAHDVVKEMRSGAVLIYVGETMGGCTGDDDFFNYLNENFNHIKVDARVPSWFGVHDEVFVLQKK